MLPIKYTDFDFLSISDASLFTLVDKETQTDLIPRKNINALIAKPGDIAHAVCYGKVREHESGILDASISKEEIERHKNEVLNAKSSHGNIYQRESCTTLKSNKFPVWKLDESFENEHPNSGYVYIPHFQTENVSNKGSVIISNQHIDLTSENCEQKTLSNEQSILISKLETCIDVNIIEDKCEKELTDISSIKKVEDQNYPETDKIVMKENTDVKLNKDDDNKELFETNSAKKNIVTDNRIIKANSDVNVNRNNDENDDNSAKTNNHKFFTETVNNNIKENSDVTLIVGIGEKEFSDVSFVENLHEKNYPKNNNRNVKENIDFNLKSNPSEQTDFDTKTSQGKKVTSVSFNTNPVERTCLDTRNGKNISDKKNNSLPSLTSGMREDRLSHLARGLKNSLSITMSVVMDPNFMESCAKSKELELKTEKENKVELCEEDKEEKTGEVRKMKKSLTSLNRNILGLESTDECPIEIKPGKYISDSPSKASGFKTNLKGESMQTIESEHLSPLVDEMRPNNEFVSEDFVFSDNGQQPPMDIDVTTDEYSEEATSLTSNHNVNDSNKLNKKSKVTEHVLNINDENINQHQSPAMNISESIGPMMITKLMGGAGSVVASLNKHINLDRIRYLQNFVTKKEELVTCSDAQKSRIRRSTDLTPSHSYVPSPADYLATIKSTIMSFFADKPAQTSDTTSNSSSGTSSELSDDETDP